MKQWRVEFGTNHVYVDAETEEKPVFEWWVPFALKRRDQIVMAVGAAQMSKDCHK